MGGHSLAIIPNRSKSEKKCRTLLFTPRPIFLSFGMACFGSMGVPDRTFSRCACSVRARFRLSHRRPTTAQVPYAAAEAANRGGKGEKGFLKTADPMLPAIATIAAEN